MLSWLGSWVVGYPFPLMQPASHTVGVYGPLGIVFSKPLQSETDILSLLSFDPSVEVSLVWNGTTAWFVPLKPWVPGTKIGVHLTPGLTYRDHQRLRVERKWMIEVRNPQVVFLQPAQNPELWRVDETSGEKLQLSHTGGKVLDFAVQRSGEWLGFSVQNDQGGADLFRVDRSGQRQESLLTCGKETCSELAWSVLGDRLAYTRHSRVTSDGQPAGSQIWILDLDTRRTVALGRAGRLASWSPDGKRLAYFDETAQAMRVSNLQQGTDMLFPARESEGVSWSEDGTRLLFISQEVGIDPPISGISLVDFQREMVSPLFNDNLTGEMDFSRALLSPDGQWALVGVRYFDGPVSKQLWLINLENGQKIEITTNQVLTQAAYAWDADGGGVVFQQLEIGSSAARPRVMHWEWQTGEITLLAENAARPAWLP